jgi:peptidoglycan/xylan/chitin deacetylase (PgdA/CDA1 family)
MFPSVGLFKFPSKLRRKARRSRMFTLLAILAVFLLFLSPLYIIYKPPNLLIRYLQYRWPDVLWHVSSVKSNIVALTIDDGPSDYTNEIIQILKENGARATFFIIGSQVQGRETILQDLIQNGNELGNHAMRDEPSRSLSDVTLVEQIQSVDDLLRDAYTAVDAPVPPRYFRPGSGLFNRNMRTMLTRLGYRLVLGSVYPHDAQISWPNLNARHVLSMVRPGSVIINHDRRSWTPPMLRRVLAELKVKGYKVVTVTELLKQAETEASLRK